MLDDCDSGVAMNKKIAKMWVEALRSKKYKKTTGAIKVVKDGKYKFSAMGVLCSLYDQTHKKKLKQVASKRLETVRRGWRIVSIDGHWDNGCRRGMWNRPALPEKVRKWAGIKSERCEFMIPEKAAYLFRFPQMNFPYTIPFLNDMEAGWNFNKIASLIEVVYEEL